ncbi:hypothetical protein ACGFU4_33165 [Streptomyces sp. NPDC048511]|uniref:hypothetical protein n=1 Tax=Streptomyces sp. NPDC048511 TaxID=3365562 RepID=UPI00371BEFC7
MDAGVAGLIGALGGGVIGAAGASLAALIAFRGARYQADRQAAASHDQWLRQIRREIYLDFIGAAWNFRMKIPSIVGGQGRFRRAQFDELVDASRILSEAYRAMQLEAPDALVALARDLTIDHQSIDYFEAWEIPDGAELTHEQLSLIVEDSDKVRQRFLRLVNECKQSLQT